MKAFIGDTLRKKRRGNRTEIGEEGKEEEIYMRNIGKEEERE